MNLSLDSTLWSYFFQTTVAASILVLLVAAVQLTIGRYLTPGWRFILWSPVLLRLLIPVFPESSLSFLNALPRLQDAEPSLVEGIEFPATQSPQMAVNSAPFEEVTAPAEMFEEERPIDWQTHAPRVALIVWASVSALLLIRLLSGAIALSIRIRGGSRRQFRELDAILQQAAADLAVPRLPRILETSLVGSPALFGLFRPMLLLPLGFSGRFAPREIRHIFLHELAHLKRRDLLLNWLMAIAQALHWFNPLVWYAFRQMRVERELACDAIALRSASQNEATAYGQTILRILQGIPVHSTPPSLVGIAEEKHSAKKRFQQIVRYRPAHRRYWLALPLLLAVILTGLTNGQNAETEAPKNESPAPAASIDPTVPDLVNQARLRLNEGKIDEARELLDRARAIEPNNKAVLYYQEVLSSRKIQDLDVGLNSPVQSKSNESLNPFSQGSSPDAYRSARQMTPAEREKLFNEEAAKRTPFVRRIPPFTVDDAGPDRSRRVYTGNPHATGGAQAKPESSTEETSPEPQNLYTRTFKLDPAFFKKEIEKVHGPIYPAEDAPFYLFPSPITPLQDAVRLFFSRAGIDFESPGPSLPNEPHPPKKAIFYNDRTGVLFVRSTLKDLDIVEHTLQLLLPRVIPVTLRVRPLRLKTPQDFIQLIKLLSDVQGTIRPVMTAREYQALMKHYRGLFVSKDVTVPAGRPAQVKMDDGRVIEMLPKAHDPITTISLNAAVIEENRPDTKVTQSGVLYHGQTLILGLNNYLKKILNLPAITITESGPVYVSTSVREVFFITVELADLPPGHNLMIDDRDDIPPQQFPLEE